MNQVWKRYLLYFAQEHVEFRFAEIFSLLKTLEISMKFYEKPSKYQPYWLVEFQLEEDVKLLASRSVSLRSCMQLWANGKTFDELHSNLKTYPLHSMEPFLRLDKSFKIEIETYGKHFTQQEKVDKIETFDYLPVKGPVKLKDPDTHLICIEYYGIDHKHPPEAPLEIFFGRMVCSGLRPLIKQLSLKTRKFIGNTSMDAQLSILMANQALVRSAHLILDPFVGSGSLLVAAAHFGGYVLGTDIDFLMLHARTKPSRITQQTREEDESIKANMKQYKLDKHYIDVLVNDFSIPFWREDLQFDAIITDPPYGIRESTERIGTSKDNPLVSEAHLATHLPAKIDYGLAGIYYDLLTFSAKHLKIGGRLVCWFPVFRDDYSDCGLPQHHCLKLIANSEQILTKHTARRLLTFEKITQFTNCETNDEKNTTIKDFRIKYYEAREETRKERRTNKAIEKARGRMEAEKRKQNKIN